MSEIQETPAPAGAGPEIATPTNLSLEAAASMWGEAKEKAQEATEPAQPSEPETEQPTETAEAAPVEVETEPSTEGDSEPAQAGEPTQDPNDPPAASWDKIDGRTRITLRSGKQWTGKQLKERIDEIEGFEEHKAAFEAEARTRAQNLQQSARQAQLIQEILPSAMAALEAQLPKVPPLPDPALARSDFLEYNAQLAAHLTGKEQYDAKVRDLQQMRQVNAQKQQQTDAERTTAHNRYIETEQAALVQKFPELRDPARRQAFVNDYLETGKTYGFTDAELTNAGDHRLFLMARDAAAYKKLMANPPKPAAAPKAVTPQAPVARPGRAVSPQEASSTSRNELIARANNNGRGVSLEELVRLRSLAK